MDFLFSKHAKEQMCLRSIENEVVIKALTHPDQMLVDEENEAIVIYHSLIKENEQMFLLRVFVNKYKEPNVIVTLYKTTKIAKYYESKI